MRRDRAEGQRDLIPFSRTVPTKSANSLDNLTPGSCAFGGGGAIRYVAERGEGATQRSLWTQSSSWRASSRAKSLATIVSPRS